MKNTICILVLLIGQMVSAQSNVLVVGGKAYSLEEKSFVQCGLPNTPENAGAIFALNAAEQLNVNLAKAKCKAGVIEFCDISVQRKIGVEGIFKFARGLKSRFTDSGCAALRDICEKKCIESKFYEEKQCSLECNQYELYNK